jgi:serine phosphatase RsbU (regulator of sigma subunit)
MSADSRNLTLSDSFAARAQQSEARRVTLWIFVLAALLLLTLARRLTGGLVKADNALFVPYAGILGFALICQIGLLSLLVSANRRGYLLGDWLWRGSAIFDLLTASALLVVAAYLSPRGPVSALTAPPLLLVPLIVMMSILRLRSHMTLWIGLAGAAVHLLLSIRALVVTDAPADAYPIYFVYGGLLAITAVAGTLVAREMKSHVREAADEATAHERAQRQVLTMQHDLAVARQIQLGLLPTGSPKMQGFDIVGMNRPADETGGDYYDWQTLPDGRLAVVLADVAGHGIGPALVMAVCRAYARSTAPTAPDPAALVTRLNELLHGDLPGDRFITFVVAILHESGRVDLISAGHGPTLLFRRASGDVEQFEGDGLPLGVSPVEEYGPVNTLSLDTGDVLVMLTDGFFEWTRLSDNEPFGIARLHEVLRTSSNGDAEMILHALDGAVRDFCTGSPQSDDMTAIVVKRTAAVASQRQV